MNGNSTQLTAAQQAAQQNAVARALWLSRGVRFRQQLPTIQGSLGNSISFSLLQVGITTGVRLFVSVPVTVTAALTASELAPHNLIQSVTLTDPFGTQRTLCSGWQLNLHNQLKHRELTGQAVAFSGNAGAGVGSINTNIFGVPAANSGNLCFELYIPASYDPASDLTGSLLTQITNGAFQVQLTFAPALVGADAAVYPYTAGTATAGSISVTPEQEYLGTGNGLTPGAPTTPLPLLDLATAYGIQTSNADSTYISVGSKKQIAWPTGRTILSALHYFENGNSGTLNETDVSQFTLLMNTNTPVIQTSPLSLRYQQRQILHTDLASGLYYISRRRQPISTANVGQVLSQFDIATVAASGVIAFQNSFEQEWPLGSALPGIGQAA